MRVPWWAAVAAAACAGDAPDCDVGFEAGPDGNCYETVDDDDTDQSADTSDTATPDDDDGVSVDDLLDSLPDCELLPPTGDLDLINLCAGPLCVDMTYEELLVADVVAPLCEHDADDDVACYWGLWDVTAWFWDDDVDGVIRPDQVPTGMYVYPDFPGSTFGGLGVGISVRCFVDVFDIPNDLILVSYGGETWVQFYSFAGYTFYVWDVYDTSGYGGDGIGDALYLNGPG